MPSHCLTNADRRVLQSQSWAISSEFYEISAIL
jgi:hypothetical protein